MEAAERFDKALVAPTVKLSTRKQAGCKFAFVIFKQPADADESMMEDDDEGGGDDKTDNLGYKRFQQQCSVKKMERDAQVIVGAPLMLEHGLGEEGEKRVKEASDNLQMKVLQSMASGSEIAREEVEVAKKAVEQVQV